MIDLSLKLSTDEVSTFSNVLAVMIHDNKDLIGADDHLHYFNMQSLCIRFKKKTLRCNFPVKVKRKLKVRVNINEFNSLKIFVKKFYPAQVNEGKEYWQILFQYFIGELQKQINTAAPGTN